MNRRTLSEIIALSVFVLIIMVVSLIVLFAEYESGGNSPPAISDNGLIDITLMDEGFRSVNVSIYSASGWTELAMIRVGKYWSITLREWDEVLLIYRFVINENIIMEDPRNRGNIPAVPKPHSVATYALQ